MCLVGVNSTLKTVKIVKNNTGCCAKVKNERQNLLRVVFEQGRGNEAL